MAQHKIKAITSIVIITLLAVAWFYGGNYNRNTDDSQVQYPQKTEYGSQAQDIQDTQNPAQNGSAAALTDTSEPTAAPIDTSGQSAADMPESNAETGSVPEDRPLPVEPQDAVVGDGSFTVTLSVRCDTILDNMNLLDKEKHELVPADGVIFPNTDVTAYEGESVFNVLQREMRRERIHMAFRNTPIYNSAYVIAINNLYEFDVGELSGWRYSVNGWFPNYGSSRYLLKSGDVIEWRFSCDLGRDLGEIWTEGWQLDE